MIQAVKFELILTLQTARTLGLTVQLALLAVARRSDRVAGRARGFTERLASNGCALGNYTFAPVATHTRCLHRDTAWVIRDRSSGAENRFMSATHRKLTQSQSLGACHEGARR